MRVGHQTTLYQTMLFFTGNKNKLKEAQEILNNSIKGGTLEIAEIQETDCEKVVEQKILSVIDTEGLFNNFIVEDSGLELGKDKEIGALIKWLPNKWVEKACMGQEATAVCVIGHSSGMIFKGEVKGMIVQARGENGFGWDEIFLPEGSTRTFAEMTPEQKNKNSPRRIALEKLKEYLEDQVELCTDVI